MNTQVFEAFRQLITDAWINFTAVPLPQIILANQQNPKPSTDFVSVLPTSSAVEGWPESRMENNIGGDLDETIRKREIWKIQMNFYSQKQAQAMVQARRMSAYLRSQRGTTLLDELNIGLIRTNQPTDLTAISSGMFESRCMLEAEVYISSVDTFGVMAIHVVDINGTLEEGNTTPMSFTLHLDLTDNP